MTYAGLLLELADIDDECACNSCIADDFELASMSDRFDGGAVLAFGALMDIADERGDFDIPAVIGPCDAPQAVRFDGSEHVVRLHDEIAQLGSYASYFDGTDTIPVGHGFTVTVKKFLSEKDFRTANAALLANKTYLEDGMGRGSVKAAVDTGAYNHSLVQSAITSWTLTDDNDRVLPINEQTISDLPNVIFRKILQRINKLNDENDEVTAAAEAEFRDEGADGAAIPERNKS